MAHYEVQKVHPHTRAYQGTLATNNKFYDEKSKPKNVAWVKYPDFDIAEAKAQEFREKTKYRYGYHVRYFGVVQAPSRPVNTRTVAHVCRDLLDDPVVGKAARGLLDAFEDMNRISRGLKPRRR